jgi:hypothetical protein
MRSTIALSVAALAGSALAAPSYGRPAPDVVENVHYKVETVVETVYVTQGVYDAKNWAPKPSKAAEYQANKPVYHAPVETIVYTVPAAAPAPPAPTVAAPKPSKVYTPAPQPTTEAPKPTAEAAKPAAPANDYMGIVDEWRAKLGLSKLECSSELEKNAMNVVVEGNGVMKHKLNPGTFGQVLAPGDPGVESFEHVFVGGWLCEIPSLPGLEGVCTDASKGWTYEGQTGHAEILTSPNYSKIGCQVHQGIWCCDLA